MPLSTLHRSPTHLGRSSPSLAHCKISVRTKIASFTRFKHRYTDNAKVALSDCGHLARGGRGGYSTAWSKSCFTLYLPSLPFLLTHTYDVSKHPYRPKWEGHLYKADSNILKISLRNEISADVSIKIHIKPSRAPKFLANLRSFAANFGQYCEHNIHARFRWTFSGKRRVWCDIFEKEFGLYSWICKVFLSFYNEYWKVWMKQHLTASLCLHIRKATHWIPQPGRTEEIPLPPLSRGGQTVGKLGKWLSSPSPAKMKLMKHCWRKNFPTKRSWAKTI